MSMSIRYCFKTNEKSGKYIRFTVWMFKISFKKQQFVQTVFIDDIDTKLQLWSEEISNHVTGNKRDIFAHTSDV